MSEERNEILDRFVKALAALESERELEPIVATFAPGCVVGNVLAPDLLQGPAGARSFWQMYRDTFREVHSTMRTCMVGDGHAALEWITEGSSREGSPIRYHGVSVLDFDEHGITRFRAYFDPGELGAQLATPRPATRPATSPRT